MGETDGRRGARRDRSELDEAGVSPRLGVRTAVTDRQSGEPVAFVDQDRVTEVLAGHRLYLAREVETLVDAVRQHTTVGEHRGAVSRRDLGVETRRRPRVHRRGHRRAHDRRQEARPEAVLLVERDVFLAVGEGVEPDVPRGRLFE